MKLQPGHQLLRLEVVTPTNLGSAAGESTLDRPTQKEAWHGLPFLPDSALKGVFAGRFGNTGDAKPNDKREPLFGSPDREEARGRAGKVVFGNGELVAFPVVDAGGRRVWVFPAAALARLLWLEESEEAGEGVLRLLGALEADSESRACAAYPAVPDLGPEISLRLEPAAARADLLPLLRRYGGQGAGDGAWLVVSAAGAARLWRLGAEIRTLTALESQSHVVEPGSLRAVEVVPPGTVFASYVSLLAEPGEDLKVELPAYVQLGAWEAQGFGWLRLDGVGDRMDGGAQAARGDGPVPALPRGGSPDLATTMTAMHRAILDLAGAEPEVRKAVKAAIGNFGGRATFGGFAAAVGFELARAKPAHPRPGTDHRAHRWLLATLLGLDSEVEAGPAAALLQWARGTPFAPDSLAVLEPVALDRWLWLRRFSEVGLKAPEGEAGEGPR